MCEFSVSVVYDPSARPNWGVVSPWSWCVCAAGSRTVLQSGRAISHARASVMAGRAIAWLLEVQEAADIVEARLGAPVAHGEAA